MKGEDQKDLVKSAETQANNVSTHYFSQFLPLAFDWDLDDYTKRSQQVVVKSKLDEIVEQVAQLVFEATQGGTCDKSLAVGEGKQPTQYLEDGEQGANKLSAGIHGGYSDSQTADHNKQQLEVVAATAEKSIPITETSRPLDNVVVTVDPKNYIRLTEIGPRESNFLLSILSAKTLIDLLDNEILPLYTSFEGQKTGGELEEILLQKQLDAGVNRYYQLVLAVVFKEIVFSITEVYYNNNLSKELVTKVSIPGPFIRSFRQKLSKKMGEMEPHFKKRQADKVDIKDLLEIVQVSNHLQKIGLKISNKEEKDNSIFLSLSVIFRSVFYLQYYHDMYTKYCSPSSTSQVFSGQFIEEDNHRYDYIFELTNGKYLLSIQQTTEGEEKRPVVQIEADLLKHLCTEFVSVLRNSDGCRACSKAGHHWRSCPAKETGIKCSSTVTRGKCRRCNAFGHSTPRCPLKQGGSQHQPPPPDSSASDEEEFGQRIKKPSESFSFTSCLSYNGSEHSKEGEKEGQQGYKHPIQAIDNSTQQNNQTASDELKEREISVLPVFIKGHPVLQVVEVGTKCSEFWMTLNAAKECITLLTTYFIPVYKKIENKAAISKSNKTLSRKFMKSPYKETTFSFEFGLNRFHYYLRIVAKFNGYRRNDMTRTVMMSAARMQPFCTDLETAIKLAETKNSAMKPKMALQNTSTSESDKDDGFSEPLVERWTSLNPKESAIGKTDHLKHPPIVAFNQLCWFDREDSQVHYISIEKNATEVLYLSIPVAVRCEECLHEFEKKITLPKNFQSASSANASSLKHCIQEKDCRYDLELVLNTPQSYLNLTETYTGKGTPSVVSMCINANQIWLLRTELKKRLSHLSRFCDQCGKVKHQSRDCIGIIVHCSLSKQDEPKNFFAVIPQNFVNERRESRNNEPEHQKFAIPKNFISSVANFEGVELSVVAAKLQSSRSRELVQITQSNGQDQVGSLQMTPKSVDELIDRLENTILQFFQFLNIKNTDGLANPVYDKWLGKPDDKCRYNLVFGFDKKQFFFKIRQHVFLARVNGGEMREISIPADYLQEFCQLLKEKINAARTKKNGPSARLEFKETPSACPQIRSLMDNVWEHKTAVNDHCPALMYSSIAPTNKSGKKIFDEDKDIDIVWQEECCFIKVTNIRAIKSYLWLCMQDANKLIGMLKQFDKEYQTLENQDAKCDRNKHLYVDSFEGLESRFHMQFGLNKIGYYLRTEQAFLNGVCRTVVVSGHAIHCFIDILNRTIIESGACFKCGQAGHFAANCRPSPKVCFKCGSYAHKKAHCHAEHRNFTPIRN